MSNQARGATTIGSYLDTEPEFYRTLNCGEQACTSLFLDSAAAWRTRAEESGVIVRWRVQSGSAGNNPIKLQVLDWPGGNISAVASSQPEELVSGLNVFETRLPIARGQQIGLECCKAPGEPILDNSLATHGEQQGPALMVGASPVPAQVLLLFGTLLVNADIEADADRDGYGDETQDRCPTDGSTHGPCSAKPDTTPPETTITKRPKNRSAKPKVEFGFSSSESGSSFECKIDRKPFKPCTSPKKLKVRRGKHKFFVRATDAIGNTDRSAAVDKFTVTG